MSKRLSESQKHHRQMARFWARQVLRTIDWLAHEYQMLAWYQARSIDPWYAEMAVKVADTITIDERRLYDNSRRAAHNAGLAIDNLWSR